MVHTSGGSRIFQTGREYLEFRINEGCLQNVVAIGELDSNLRENAQENRAKRKISGHSRKPNLPSFSVYKEVLTGRFLELFKILDFARLKPEINRLTRENRPAEKTASRNQTC